MLRFEDVCLENEHCVSLVAVACQFDVLGTRPCCEELDMSRSHDAATTALHGQQRQTVVHEALKVGLPNIIHDDEHLLLCQATQNELAHLLEFLAGSLHMGTP